MRLSARRRRGAAAAALALLTGCGGSTAAPEAAPSPDRLTPVAAVRAAADSTSSAGSSRIELVSDTKAAGQSFTITVRGVYDYAARTGALTTELPAAAGGGAIEQRILGDTLYMKLPQEPDVFYQLDTAALAGSSFANTSDPSASFQALKGVSEDVREVGTQDVRGTATTHYTGTYDVRAAIEQAQGAVRQLLEKTLGSADLSSVPFDVYLDDQQRVRKFEQTLELPASEQTGGQPVTSRTVMELFDFGTPVEVTAPPADQVKDGAPLLEALNGATSG